MSSCDKCFILLTKNKKICEIYLNSSNIKFKKTDIKNICEYLGKYQDEENIKNLCYLISII